MAYLALYRQYRPKVLAEVVEQEHIVRTLSNAIKQGRLAHAYLFSGPRGTGKTTIARVLARSLNCEKGPTLTPCGVCASCRSIDAGTSVDVREIDAASNRGINDIREIRQALQYIAESRYKIYIIDEVHMLTPEAFNALLKTLEEPPANIIFILATTEVHKVPLTILSRCQRYDFRRISPQGMITQMRMIAEQGHFTISEDALRVLAIRAQGGMRDALSLLDQCLSYAGDTISLNDLLAVLGSVDQQTLRQAIEAMLAGDIPELLALLDRIEREGKDLIQFLRDLLQQLRDWLTEKSPLADLQPAQLVTLLNILATADWEMKQAAQPRLILELAMFKAGEAYRYGDRLKKLEARIEQLEQQNTQGGSAVQTNRSENPQTAVSKSAPPAEARLNNSPSSESKPIQQQQTQAGRETPETAASAAVAEPVNLSAAELSAAAQQNPQQTEVPAADDWLSRVRAKWPDILQQVLREKISAHAVLKQGELYEANENSLMVVFQAEFHKKVMEKADNRAVIEKAIAAAMGIPLRFISKTQKEIISDLPKKETISPAPLLRETSLPQEEDWFLQSAYALAGQNKVDIIRPEKKNSKKGKD
ncbi:MAG: DNA polymerase III subunit gamma/tau [Negativicutes bacterium]|nr:DNA polymerase III subunit gamma/tau [Negativicutes bacterium]